MKKLKKECCERYLRKSSACSACPLIALIPISKRKKTIKKLRKLACQKQEAVA